MSWGLYQIGREFHVIPLGDYRPHTTSKDCFCRPTEDDEQPGLWTHHSVDTRECYEAGERRLS